MTGGQRDMLLKMRSVYGIEIIMRDTYNCCGVVLCLEYTLKECA